MIVYPFTPISNSWEMKARLIMIVIITFTVFLMNINHTLCGQSQAAAGGMISIEG